MVALSKLKSEPRNCHLNSHLNCWTLAICRRRAVVAARKILPSLLVSARELVTLCRVPWCLRRNWKSLRIGAETSRKCAQCPPEPAFSGVGWMSSGYVASLVDADALVNELNFKFRELIFPHTRRRVLCVNVEVCVQSNLTRERARDHRHQSKDHSQADYKSLRNQTKPNACWCAFVCSLCNVWLCGESSSRMHNENPSTIDENRWCRAFPMASLLID